MNWIWPRIIGLGLLAIGVGMLATAPREGHVWIANAFMFLAAGWGLFCTSISFAPTHESTGEPDHLQPPGSVAVTRRRLLGPLLSGLGTFAFGLALVLSFVDIRQGVGVWSTAEIVGLACGTALLAGTTFGISKAR